jgi:hypothetical protein
MPHAQPPCTGRLGGRTFEFGNGHEHAELELANGILLRGVDSLACANQGHVSHLQFPDDDRQMSQT